MSAEIIKFPTERKSELPACISRVATFADPPKPPHNTVRCAVDGQLYDVEFSGKNVMSVHTVFYRRNGEGRMEQVRRRQWSAVFGGRRDLDPAVAWPQRVPWVARPLPISDLAIALLRARHAKLLHIAAKVERMLAKLEQGEAVQS